MKSHFQCIIVAIAMILLQSCSLPTNSSTDDDLSALLTIMQVSNIADQNSDWQNYTMVITATTSNPTKASNPIIDRATWRRVGDSMEIAYSYAHSSNAGAVVGTGTYLFSMPPGYTVDSNKIDISTLESVGIVGVAAYADGVNKMTGVSKIYASNQLALQVGNDTNNHQYMAGGPAHAEPFGAIDRRISFHAMVPIAGW